MKKFKWKAELLTPREWEIMKDVEKGLTFEEMEEKYELSGSRIHKIWCEALESLEHEDWKVNWFKSDEYKKLRFCSKDLEEYARKVSVDISKAEELLQDISYHLDTFCRYSVQLRKEVDDWMVKYEEEKSVV